MSRTLILKHHAALLLAPILISLLPSALADVQWEIGGHVHDFDRRPVVGAQVRLLDEHGETLITDNTDESGSFSLKHKLCERCDLEVIPAEKSSLSSALLENIPGNANRTFLLTLKKGFRITGRVISQKHGLKGIEVRITGAPESASADRHAHVGGIALTTHDGEWKMTLTPGAKMLTIINNKYTNLVSRYEREFTVTADAHLPEIDLPYAR